MLKTFFISSMDKKEAADLFTHQLLERTKKVDMLKQKLHALIEEDRSAESLHSAQFGHYLVLTRAIEREKAMSAGSSKPLNGLIHPRSKDNGRMI